VKQTDSALENINPKSDPGSSSVNPPLSLARPSPIIALCGWVGVHLPLSSGEGDVHESACVCDSLLRATLRGLLLLLRLNLWCLRLDLSGTSERSVNLSHDCGLSNCSCDKFEIP